MEPVKLTMAAIAIAVLQLCMSSLSPVSNLTYVSKFTPRNQSIIQENLISSNFSSQCSNLLAVFSFLSSMFCLGLQSAGIFALFLVISRSQQVDR